MATTGYSDLGEEWSQKESFRQDTITRSGTIDVLLFDDSTDMTSDTSDIGDITTEPTDGNYVRQTVTLDSTDITLSVVSGDLRAEATVTFDLTDTTGTADAWGVVDTFQSDVVNAEGTENEHLLSTATFDAGSRDLSVFTSLDVTIRLDLN